MEQNGNLQYSESSLWEYQYNRRKNIRVYVHVDTHIHIFIIQFGRHFSRISSLSIQKDFKTGCLQLIVSDAELLRSVSGGLHRS